jgi:hypothetical protein|tara:strand:+ start:1446 stop:1643 length:198 start_codon:yes stop_codon:yes gene_type:complete
MTSKKEKLAVAIDNLRSELEDYHDDLRFEWEGGNDTDDELQHMWNIEDAASLLEKAVALIHPEEA